MFTCVPWTLIDYFKAEYILVKSIFSQKLLITFTNYLSSINCDHANASLNYWNIVLTISAAKLLIASKIKGLFT